MPNQTTYRGASGTSPKPRKYCNTTKVAWESKNEEFMRIASFSCGSVSRLLWGHLPQIRILGRCIVARRTFWRVR